MVKLLRGYFSPTALHVFRKDYEGAIIKVASVDISQGSGGRRHYRKVTRGQQLMLNEALVGPTPKGVVEINGCVSLRVSGTMYAVALASADIDFEGFSKLVQGDVLVLRSDVTWGLETTCYTNGSVFLLT